MAMTLLARIDETTIPTRAERNHCITTFSEHPVRAPINLLPDLVIEDRAAGQSLWIKQRVNML
jgi:hypothetical protein